MKDDGGHLKNLAQTLFSLEILLPLNFWMTEVVSYPIGYKHMV